MSDKYLVTGFTEQKTSKNGKKYLTLNLETNNPLKRINALYFFDEFDISIGTWVELDVVEKNEQFFANKPKPKKNWSGGGNRGMSFDEQKRLKAMELAVNMVIANKVEMKDLEKVKKRIEELI